MAPSNRLAFLDALRGLAAVYVVIFHVMAMPSPALATGPVMGAILAMGGTGVALFFVISAFSLAYTMPRHAATPRPLLSFYLHRVFRIAPLFFVLLAFSIWRDGRGSHSGHSATEILANVTFTFNLFDGWEAGIVWASWAIGVEMLFYAVFPLLFHFIHTLTRASVAALLGTIISLLAVTGVLGAPGLAGTGDYGLLRHLPVFLYGILAYHAFKAMQAMSTGKAKRCGMALLVAVGSLLAVLTLGSAQAIIAPGIGWGLFGATYAVLLVAMSLLPLSVVVNRATTYLGQVSYSLYLGHPIVIALLIPMFRRIQAFVPHADLAYLICAALTLAIALPLAHLGYRFIEVPGIRAGHRLLAYINARRTTAMQRADQRE
ncbi:acyltransferase [Stenotrophomonas sp. TWI819]|uniref:acyltransferase family protein n=1 Tax=Stenotrophomonas sp. TWI819 TaxID=3136800 RepID=UPI00320962F1